MSMVAQQGVTLEPAHRRWLLVKAIVIPMVVNAIGSGGIAWITSVNEKTVPLLSLPIVQKPSTMTDTLGTLFILPFLTGLLVTLSVRRDQRSGHLPPLELSPRRRQVIACLPETLLRRAVAFGILCLVCIGPFAALALALAGFGGIAESSFIFYKIIFCVGLGLVVTPAIAVVSMADPLGNDGS